MESDARATFRIEGFTPATLPMERLAEYLAQIAILLGDPLNVHFVRIKKGSAIPEIRIDSSARERVRARTVSVRMGLGPADAMKAAGTINTYLKDDKTKGTLRFVDKWAKSNEIIKFPGVDTPAEKPMSVKQIGSVDGELERVGGSGKLVPLTLRSEGIAIPYIFAHRPLAQELAKNLFKQVRLFGRGVWVRSTLGEWSVENFVVRDFNVLNDEPLSKILSRISEIKGGEWGLDSLDEIASLSDGFEE